MGKVIRGLLLPFLILLIVLPVFLFSCSTSPYANLTNFSSGRGANLICFGDSLTAGEGAQPGTAYPDLLSGNVKFPVINAGVSGDTTRSALARLDRDVIDKNPRVVIIELGANDYLQSAGAAQTEDAAFDNLKQMVIDIQSAGALVVIADVFITADWSVRYKQLAKAYGCLYIPDALAGVMNDPAMMSDDGLHPNSFGYAKMAANIMNVLQPMLKAMP